MNVLVIASRIFYKHRSVLLKNVEISAHLDAAVAWLVQAHEKAGDGGISKGYDLFWGRWSPSYPETTGYSIPTLLNYIAKVDDQQLLPLVAKLGEYLITKATPDGGVVHWVKGSSLPIVFDTGQVIFGWLACSKVFGDARYLDVSIKAGDWLVSIQDSSGCWKENQHLGVTKVIDSRAAWALLELYKYTGQEKYRTAARHNLDWVVAQQRPNGWFDNCAFKDGDYPITHTLAYTAEGLMECGLILNDFGYVNASKLTADAFLVLQQNDGSLAGVYDQDWKPKSFSSLLTGNCQIANLWLKLYKITRDEVYLDAAVKAIGFVAGVQDVTTRNSNLRGAIPGSHPIYGRYERLKYPNWATKFFIDSLLFLDDVISNRNIDYFPG